MVHQYRIGDKVRIKKREGKDTDYPCFFVNEMSKLEGKILTITDIRELYSHDHYKKYRFYNEDDHCYSLENNGYSWHSSMFEPVLQDSESQISASLKKGDLIQICGMMGTIEINEYRIGSSFYLYFNNISDQTHTSCCKKLRELVPNFNKIANKFNTVCNIDDLFPEFSTIDELIQFTQAINAEYNPKQPTILKKSETYEIRFQKPKTSSIRGSVPTGRAICGRRCKTAIELGHLSNKACYC